jgi:hypothetical protein
MLFELSHENAGLETLHFHGESKQFKIRLPLAFAKLPSKTSFKRSKGSIADIYSWRILY